MKTAVMIDLRSTRHDGTTEADAYFFTCIYNSQIKLWGIEQDLIPLT